MKRRISKIIGVFALLVMLISCKSTDNEEQAIRLAIGDLLHDYPEASLQDIYKSCFQDYFGIGHLVNDSVVAVAYLDHELAENDTFPGPYFEGTGYEHRYYRANIRMVIDSIITKEQYIGAVLESAKYLPSLTHEQWVVKWHKIESIAAEYKKQLPTFENDSALIDSVLSSGEYAMRHSKKYHDTYHPHYRIIKCEVFDKRLRPYLDE